MPITLLSFLMQAALKGWIPISYLRQHVISNVVHDDVPTNTEPRQLLVDISVIHAHDAGTGIQRVVRTVLKNLKLASLDRYVIRTVVGKGNVSYRYADGKNKGMEVAPQYGDIFLGLDLSAHILPRHIKQIIKWKSLGVKFHFVVYDILPITHPIYFKNKRSRHFELWIRLISIISDSLLCISQTVKSELQKWLAIHANSISKKISICVIPLGSDFRTNASDPSIVRSHVASVIEGLSKKPWVLMVGTLEPRKSHIQLLEAFEYLWDQGLQVSLVFAGRPGWTTEELQNQIRTHPLIGRNLFWLHDTTDFELELFYQKSSGVIVASRAEGYGLPLIEALHYKKPLLVRDIPVFREVAGSRADYFSDDTPISLSKNIKNWLDKPKDISSVSYDLPLVSWSETVDHILCAIHAIAPREKLEY